MPQPTLTALRGRIVTMDPDGTIFDDGVLYLSGPIIAAVQDAALPPPEAFAKVRRQQTGGTLYPGLIDLHNHLSYNILPLWKVPRRYSNRDDWGRHADYRRLISGPMNVLGRTAGYPAAIARYAECKCLIGGVTTSQGIALFSNSGMSGFYRGFLRNPEVSDGPGFPAAHARIADVVPEEAERFAELLRQKATLLLHLSEGTDLRAHAHFEALRLPNGDMAIGPSLVGIHCVALKRRDFDQMARHGASMVWSPFSNLLLYGKTANVAAARRAGVNIALGADWSPSGSKQLLGELKVAKAVSDAGGGLFSDEELVAMATRNAARAIKWHNVVGSLESGKRADVLLVAGRDRPPYAQLLSGREADIALVMIDGVPRFGLPKWMKDAARPETFVVHGRKRVFDLAGTGDGPLKAPGLQEAASLLQQGLQDLVSLAKALEKPQRSRRSAGGKVRTEWFLDLEDIPLSDIDRPRRAGGVPARASRSAAKRLAAPREMARAGLPLSSLLGPLTLDPLTVCDQKDYLDGIAAQANLPPAIREALAKALG